MLTGNDHRQELAAGQGAGDRRRVGRHRVNWLMPRTRANVVSKSQVAAGPDALRRAAGSPPPPTAAAALGLLVGAPARIEQLAVTFV